MGEAGGGGGGGGGRGGEEEEEEELVEEEEAPQARLQYRIQPWAEGGVEPCHSLTAENQQRSLGQRCRDI